MSKKSLQRTAIEGGRTGAYKCERKESLRKLRHQKQKLVQEDGFEDPVFEQRKKSTMWVDEKFKDKLSPVRRWLDSQIGKSWNKVYSLMREKFDDRSTPGRHILFDHMVRDINTNGEDTPGYERYRRYYVDKHGLLRKTPERKYGFGKTNWHAAYMERAKIGEWLSGRLVGKVGNILYWFEPTTAVPNPLMFSWNYDEICFHYQSNGYVREWLPHFRQGKKLEGKDVEFFSNLFEENKERLLKQSPLQRAYDNRSYIKKLYYY